MYRGLYIGGTLERQAMNRPWAHKQDIYSVPKSIEH